MLINVFVKEQIDTYVTLYNHVSGPTWSFFKSDHPDEANSAIMSSCDRNIVELQMYEKFPWY
jgi:hypothetical protein